MSNDFAGIEQHVNELALKQTENNEVHIISTKEIAHQFDQNLNVISINNFGRRSLFNIYKLFKIIKKLNPHIIHTHGSKTTQIIQIIKSRLNAKYACTIHGIKSKTNIYENADIIIGVSDKTIKSIKNKALVINNWWNPSYNEVSIPKNDQPKFAIAIGRLEKVKGFDQLIKSWEGVESKLLIIGSGTEKNSLNQLIEDLKLGHKIQIIDQVPSNDLVKYYAQASVLIVSSLREGGPRVALEALYMKVPVISTDVGHMNKILPKEFLAEPNNQTALRELIVKYVNKMYLFDQSSIFEYVSEEFSLESQSTKILKAYKESLSRS
jgi:glycosyltransferase involved in cell wall biosynthesis